MDKVISKKEKKKEYNLNYLKKQKEQLEQLKEPKVEVKNENNNIREIVNKEMNFFFQKQKATQATQPPAIPQAIVLQTPPSNLKNKMIETLMITSLGLIPLIAKALYAIKFTNTSTDTQPKPSNTQQQHLMDTQLLFS